MRSLSKAVRLGGLVLVTLALGTTAAAERTQAILSVASPPPVPFGTISVDLDYDPTALAPVIDETDPSELLVVGDVLELGIASGCLVLPTVADEDTVRVDPICVGPVAEAGELLFVEFDTLAGAPPLEDIAPDLVIRSATADEDVSTIAPEDFPTLALELVPVPEPRAELLSGAALGALVGLAGLRRASRSKGLGAGGP